MTRQQIIMGKQRTALSVIIGEGALRRRAGEPEVMREQLRWLATVSGKCGWVRVQVAPFAGPFLGGPVTILRFGTVPGLGVVYLPVLDRGGIRLVDQADVAGHVQAFTRLQASALPPDQSVRMLQEMAAQGGLPVSPRPARELTRGEFSGPCP